MRYPLLCALLTLPLLAACVNAIPPTDTGDPVVSTPTAPTGTTTTPTTPTTPTTTTTSLAYNQDLKAIFQSDCVSCHGAGRADGNYRMTTYQQVMTAVVPGNANSRLVRVTQVGGSMYRYWSGSAATRQAKADQVRAWVVSNNAQENR